MLVLNRNILTIGGNRLEGGPLTPPEPPIPPIPVFDEVTIGTQTWMAKNLAIDDRGDGIYHEDNVTANGVNFGTQYYYNYTGASRIADSIDGWHLPSLEEFNTLITYCGGGSAAAIKLKSTYGWNTNNGTDDYGFCALPVADVYNNSTSGRGVGSQCYYCSNSKFYDQGTLRYRIKQIGTSNIYESSYPNNTIKVTVRLIKDT